MSESVMLPPESERCTFRDILPLDGYPVARCILRAGHLGKHEPLIPGQPYEQAEP